MHHEEFPEDIYGPIARFVTKAKKEVREAVIGSLMKRIFIKKQQKGEACHE